MRTIKIPFPSITYYEKTRLAAPPSDPSASVVASGSAEFYFRNSIGFSDKDFLVLDAFESETAEIVQADTIDRDVNLADLGSGQTYQDHNVGALVVKTPYNKVKLFKGSTSDVTSHTEMSNSPYNLRPDVVYTYVNDETGTTTDFYSYQYTNTTTSAVGTQTLYVDSSYDTVLTVQQLLDWFLYGIDLTDEDGNAFPTSMYEFAIKSAVDALEKMLDIVIKPTSIFEYQDFHAQDYRDFAFIQLNHWPVVSVEQIRIKYPTATSDILFPREWYQFRTERGQVHLLPTSGTLSTILLGRGGDYLDRKSVV